MAAYLVLGSVDKVLVVTFEALNVQGLGYVRNYIITNHPFLILLSTADVLLYDPSPLEIQRTNIWYWASSVIAPIQQNALPLNSAGVLKGNLLREVFI